jgi:protein-L-isoaspartate(D-aspartate) O-methyltransferase
LQGFEAQRERLVKSLHLKDRALEKAFLAVKREAFFPEKLKESAYEDSAFPIGLGQTISQPSTIAAMLELLDVRPGQRVLEVGAGSGYVSALLSELAGSTGKVFGVELLHELHQRATKTLLQLGHRNVFLKCGDGRNGWREKAPFDRVLVSAACDSVPGALTGQLAGDGKLVAPLGNSFLQELVLFGKKGNRLAELERKCCYVFVGLHGSAGE